MGNMIINYMLSRLVIYIIVEINITNNLNLDLMTIIKNQNKIFTKLHVQLCIFKLKLKFKWPMSFITYMLILEK